MMNQSNLRKSVREFAVIVLGVLTALSADAMVDRFNDSRTAAEYRSMLVDDLRATSEDLLAMSSFNREVADSAEAIFEVLTGRRSPSSDTSVVRQAMYAAERWTATASHSTWTDLLSTGQLRLLGRTERLELSDFYQVVDFAERLEELIPRGYREAVRRIVPHDQQRTLGMCVVYGAAVRLDTHCPPPVNDAKDLAQAILASPGLAGDVNAFLPNLRALSAVQRNLGERAAALADTLATR